MSRIISQGLPGTALRWAALLFAALILFGANDAQAQLPDPNEIYSTEPGSHTPLQLDSTTAEILASDTLTPYMLAQMEPPPPPWTLVLESNLTVNQSAYTTNWDGNEQGTFVWTAYLNGLAQKEIVPWGNTRTTLKMAFGRKNDQDRETRHWSEPKSSVDRIDIESLLRLTVGWPLDPFVSAQVQSAFLDSRGDRQVFFNPTRFTESVGGARVIWKEDRREMLARGGAALRQSLDRNAPVDTVNSFVRRGTAFTYDGGMQVVVDLKTPLFDEKVRYTGRFSVFQALFFSDETGSFFDDRFEPWEYPDVDIESTFTADITELLNVSLFVWWRYDREVAKGGRLKQTLALGLSYTIL